MYSILYTKKAAADIRNLKTAKLDRKAKALIDLIKEDPYRNPPPYEKLVGNLSGTLSRRINIKHRLVYQVDDSNKSVKVVSMWSHYEF